MLTLLRTIAITVLLAVGLGAAGGVSAAGHEQKVVYHINDSSVATSALTNIRNHLNAYPDARIVVVAHGPGIDFLLKGAKNANGGDYETLVQELSMRNVDFRVCNNTLEARKIDRSRVLPEATIVPSGVGEIARLQAEEGFVYLKP